MRKFFILISAFLVTACTTGTGQFGASYVHIAPPDISADINGLKKWQMPSFYLSDTLESDMEMLSNRGFVILGSSSFRGGVFSRGHAANKAVEVGATHVIYSQRIIGANTSDASESELMFAMPVNLMGFAAAAPPISGVDIGKIVTSGNNNRSTTYQNIYYNPQSGPVMAFDYKSYFLAKPAKHRPSFGLTFEDGGSKGVVVNRVAQRSVAETLKLRQFDMITNINGTPVNNIRELDQILLEVDEISDQTTFFITRGDEKFISVIPPIMGNLVN